MTVAETAIGSDGKWLASLIVWTDFICTWYEGRLALLFCCLRVVFVSCCLRVVFVVYGVFFVFSEPDQCLPSACCAPKTLEPARAERDPQNVRQ